MHLRDPNKGFTALEWAEFCGRKPCVEVIKSYSKPMSRGKRLSQAWNDTETWLKSLKLGGNNTNNNNCNQSPCNSPITMTNHVNLLAKASAASLLCTSAPILNGHPMEGDQHNNNERKTRNFVIPSIYITEETVSS